LKNKGFTLIELSAVIIVLALLSAVVVPRLAVVRNSVEAKLSLDAIQRLASRGRELAISSGTPVQMAFNETDAQFELRQTVQNEESSIVGQTALHRDFSATRFRAGQNDMTASDWVVTFYSDATSDGGAIEVDEGGIVRTFIIGSKNGLSRWQDGAMPASESDRWQAGEIEQRGG
jgi:prepilin-type N-terminal cleavage/methylation domain-containing protein